MSCFECFSHLDNTKEKDMSHYSELDITLRNKADEFENAAKPVLHLETLPFYRARIRRSRIQRIKLSLFWGALIAITCFNVWAIVQFG